MPETLTQKVVRHMKEGAFDGDTLKSGTQQFLDLVKVFRESEGDLTGPIIARNYGGINDFNVADYKFIIPPFNFTKDSIRD